MLIRPYVPKQKQNMVAWLYADCDGDDYGELGIVKLAKDKLVYGPLQVEARADQDPLISQQLSLWNQRGSRVLRGNLLVIPLEDTFLYIEPLYLEAESGQLPELKRIIVAYNDKVAMAPTLDEALMQVLNGTVTPKAGPHNTHTAEATWNPSPPKPGNATRPPKPASKPATGCVMARNRRCLKRFLRAMVGVMITQSKRSYIAVDKRGHFTKSCSHDALLDYGA